MKPRTLYAVSALTIGAMWAGGDELAARTADKQPVKPGPRCTRTALPGEYRCTFPTHSHLRAVVYVQTYEDGSARTISVDPDTRARR